MIELANETGKRYSCGQCGSEFVVTRGAEGTIECCGEQMSKKKLILNYGKEVVDVKSIGLKI